MITLDKVVNSTIFITRKERIREIGRLEQVAVEVGKYSLLLDIESEKLKTELVIHRLLNKEFGIGDGYFIINDNLYLILHCEHLNDY